MRESRPYGSERGAFSNGRLYRDRTDGHRGRSEIASYSSLHQSMRAACSRPAPSRSRSTRTSLVGLRGFKPRCSWRCVRVTAARRERGSGSGRASRLRQARRVRRQREGSSAQRSATSTPITDVTAEVRVRAFERPPGPNRRLRVCRARDRQSGRVCARPIAVRCCAKRRAALAVRLTMISDAIRSPLPM
jgi:hypothetical protein